MNPFVAYCQIAEYLVNRKFFVPEEISGKTVLLIGGNSVRTNVAQKQTPCEVLRRYFLANGAEKCLVFDPLPIYFSAEQAAIEEYHYDYLTNLIPTLKPEEDFDIIVVLEGLERVSQISQTLADLRGLVHPGGAMYLLARTPTDVSGGPVSSMIWYEDIWRYTAKDMVALFPEAKVSCTNINAGSIPMWVAAKIENIDSAKYEAKPVPLYSCRARRKITEGDLPQLGYFHQNGLDGLGRKYHTDKSTCFHNYLNKYEHFLSSLKNETFTLLELGVYKGGSVRTWESYFPYASIVGVDIDPACRQYATDRVHIDILDLGEASNLSRLSLYKPRLIIDDASHMWSHQIKALFALFGILPSGGIYILEDLGTSLNTTECASYNDFHIDAYTVCEKIARVVAGKEACREDPFAEQITAIGMATEMVAIIRGSCIFIKR